MTKKPESFRGKAWVLTDSEGEPINDIDTDMIYHNAHLAETEVEKMGRYALGNLEGWEDFPQKVSAGDIVIAAKNFGCGSSRQHAVECFRALGVSCLVVESAGAIYRRNAINSGFPLLVAPGITKSGIETGDVIVVDIAKGVVNCPDKEIQFSAEPFSDVQMEIYRAGSLFDVKPG
ncbi:MAG: 3-isopropylmalate dehydratase [Planctomycetota bacterium]|nr:3-isopropylmalate dehydratase [Planctomycetota bacterium]